MTQVDTPQSVCTFGIAHRDITPPVGIYHRMWGAATHDRSTGVHRPLRATAMVFGPSAGDDADRQVVIALDHCLLSRREMDALLERVASDVPLPRERLLVTFSHTHAAGLMSLDRADLPGGDLIAPYLEDVAAQVAAAVNDALGAVEPATLVYATGRCDLARHRDYWDEAHGTFVCGFNPEQSADDTLLVACVVGAAGDTRATIVNYACHPTTLAWDNQLVSPDYPGAMRELVEQATGAPCVFLQGASGDLGPRDGYVGDVAVADRNGRQLGHAALSALEGAPPAGTALRYVGPVISGATIGVWEHQPLDDAARQAKRIWRRENATIDLRYRPDLPRVDETRAQRDDWLQKEHAARAAGDHDRARDARAMAERATRQLDRLTQLPTSEQFPYAVTLWRMGDAVWLGVAGEPYNVLQTALRSRFPGTPIVLMVLCGGWGPSYLPSADAYGKPIYQTSIAVVQKGSLEQLIDALGNQIASWLAM